MADYTVPGNNTMGAAVLPYLPAIGSIFQGLGSGITGQAQAKTQKQQIEDQWKLQSGQEASQLQHQQDTAPIRDQAMYMIQQRLGMTPQTFKPHDLYNQSTSSATPQYGGYNPQQLQQAAANYQPGMGGVNTGVNQQAIGGMGYTTSQSNPLPQSAGAQSYGQAQDQTAAKQAQLQQILSRFK